MKTSLVAHCQTTPKETNGQKHVVASCVLYIFFSSVHTRSSHGNLFFRTFFFFFLSGPAGSLFAAH